MTGITQTFSLKRREALFDEIEKLSAQESKNPKKKSIWKKYLRTPAVAIAGRAVAGTLVGELADRGIQKIIGSEKYNKIPDAAKLKVLLPVLGLSLLAHRYAVRRSVEARYKNTDNE